MFERQWLQYKHLFLPLNWAYMWLIDVVTASAMRGKTLVYGFWWNYHPSWNQAMTIWGEVYMTEGFRPKKSGTWQFAASNVSIDIFLLKIKILMSTVISQRFDHLNLFNTFMSIPSAYYFECFSWIQSISIIVTLFLECHSLLINGK